MAKRALSIVGAALLLTAGAAFASPQLPEEEQYPTPEEQQPIPDPTQPESFQDDPLQQDPLEEPSFSPEAEQTATLGEQAEGQMMSGTVVTIGTDNLVVETESGQETFQLASGMSLPSELAEGDVVIVRSSTPGSADQVVKVEDRVEDAKMAGMQERAVLGTVASSSDDQLIVETADGPETFLIEDQEMISMLPAEDETVAVIYSTREAETPEYVASAVVVMPAETAIASSSLAESEVGAEPTESSQLAEQQPLESETATESESSLAESELESSEFESQVAEESEVAELEPIEEPVPESELAQQETQTETQTFEQSQTFEETQTSESAVESQLAQQGFEEPVTEETQRAQDPSAAQQPGFDEETELPATASPLAALAGLGLLAAAIAVGVRFLR